MTDVDTTNDDTDDWKCVPLGIHDGEKLAEGDTIVIEAVDGTPIQLDTTLDPDA